MPAVRSDPPSADPHRAAEAFRARNGGERRVEREHAADALERIRPFDLHRHAFAPRRDFDHRHFQRRVRHQHRARAIEAVQKLRAANNLRVGAAHGASSARERRLKAQTTLAIQFYPDATWGETWNQLRARVTDALSEITAALRQS